MNWNKKDHIMAAQGASKGLFYIQCSCGDYVYSPNSTMEAWKYHIDWIRKMDNKNMHYLRIGKRNGSVVIRTTDIDGLLIDFYEGGSIFGIESDHEINYEDLLKVISAVPFKNQPLT